MKKTILGLLVLMVAISSLTIATKAAFSDTGKVLGTTFMVGSADVKLVDNLSGGVDTSNLVDTKLGPVFANLYPGWSQDYPLKIYNDGSLNINLESSSNYTTADDPGSLREYVNVEIFTWDDANHDGVIDLTEVSSSSLAKKTLLRWKTEGIPLGTINAGELKGFVLRFSSASIPDTKQGLSAKYDFEFDGTTASVAQ